MSKNVECAYYSMAEVSTLVMLGKTQIYLMMNKGEFPLPIKLGQRRVGWVKADLHTWLESRKVTQLGLQVVQKTQSAPTKLELVPATPAAAPQLFNFDTHAVRVIKGEDGEPWFVAKDVAEILGYAHAPHATRTLDDDEKAGVRIVDTSSTSGITQSREVIIINESGLYSLILGSRKPEAKRFKKWVTGTVLPAIRKDGMYVMGEEKVAAGEMNEDELVLAAMSLLQKKVERFALENKALTKELTTTKATLEDATEIIKTELGHNTVDEFIALNHFYADHGERVSLGLRTACYCRANNLTIVKQPRKVWNKRDQCNEDRIVNEYPVEALRHIYDDMVAKGKFKTLAAA